MRVLWIVNMVFPAVAEHLGIKTSASGGWLLDLARGVGASPDVELTVMTYYDGPFRDLTLDGVRYLLFSGGSKRLLYENPKTEEDCKKAVELCNPDLIHIHGTEYAPGLSMLKAYPEIPTLLTIQGILRRISEEYGGGMSALELLKMSSLKDILRLKTPIAFKWLYKHNAKREAEILRRVRAERIGTKPQCLP